MKKWLIGSSLVLVLLAGVYIFIPAKLVIVKSLLLHCSANGAARFLSKESNWSKWWPSNDVLRYHVVGFTPTIVDLSLSHGNSTMNSRMIILPGEGPDSAQFNWECSLDAGTDPISRVRKYLEARYISVHMDSLVGILQPFIQSTENIYGFNIRKNGTTDSFLLASRVVLPVEPSTGYLYNMLAELKAYIVRQGAKITDYPMVSTTDFAGGYCHVMAAIPVDRKLPPKGNIFLSKLVAGKYLVTEVRGGPFAMNEALAEMQNYIADYRLTVMAIPFQSLVTDRSIEPDSAKWITRMYYPVN